MLFLKIFNNLNKLNFNLKIYLLIKREAKININGYNIKLKI